MDDLKTRFPERTQVEITAAGPLHGKRGTVLHAGGHRIDLDVGGLKVAAPPADLRPVPAHATVNHRSGT